MPVRICTALLEYFNFRGSIGEEHIWADVNHGCPCDVLHESTHQSHCHCTVSTWRNQSTCRNVEQWPWEWEYLPVNQLPSQEHAATQLDSYVTHYLTHSYHLSFRIPLCRDYDQWISWRCMTVMILLMAMECNSHLLVIGNSALLPWRRLQSPNLIKIRNN